MSSSISTTSTPGSPNVGSFATVLGLDLLTRDVAADTRYDIIGSGSGGGGVAGVNASLLAAHFSTAAVTAAVATDATGSTGSLNYVYAALELTVALAATVGNAAVITVFCRERRLRKRTNYYIVALAMADFLVGLLGIPFAILASVGLPRNLYGCLLTLSTLVVLCTISIFCLVAVSIDRYWAILYPLAYSRTVRTKTAICESCLICTKHRQQ